jgi:hypothetical protein
MEVYDRMTARYRRRLLTDTRAELYELCMTEQIEWDEFEQRMAHVVRAEYDTEIRHMWPTKRAKVPYTALYALLGRLVGLAIMFAGCFTGRNPDPGPLIVGAVVFGTALALDEAHRGQ